MTARSTAAAKAHDQARAALVSLAIIFTLGVYGAGVMSGLMIARPESCVARAWP